MQIAKHGILEFYSDSLDKCIKRRDFHLNEIDTDSLQVSLSAAFINLVVKKELKEGYHKEAKAKISGNQ